MESTMAGLSWGGTWVEAESGACVREDEVEAAPRSPRLLDQVRSAMRLRRMSPRTEMAYCGGGGGPSAALDFGLGSLRATSM